MVKLPSKEIYKTMATKAKKAAPKKKKSVTARPAVKAAPAARTSGPKFTVTAAIEITATFPDTMGLTAKVAAALAAENVNILAGTGYSASGMRRITTKNSLLCGSPAARAR